MAAQQFIENIDAIIWAVELPSMNFVFASPQAEKLLGFAPEHWTSHPSFWLDRIRRFRSRLGGPVLSARHRNRAPRIPASSRPSPPAGGSRVAARICPSASRAAEGQPRYLIGVAVDVTERRMLEDQLVQSERVEAVSRLASRMAHDLNNMLMILTGYSEELLTGLPAGSTLRADVQEILAATERMSGLTSQLLSFARRQGGRSSEMDLESTLGRFGPRLSALLGTHVGLELHHVRRTQPGPRRHCAVGTSDDRDRRASAASHARRRKDRGGNFAPGGHAKTCGVPMPRCSRATMR